MIICSSYSHSLAYDIFNLKLRFENNLHHLTMPFLSIVFCQRTNEQRMTAFFTWRQATKETIEKDSNDWNGNRIQTHRRPCCTPKSDADLCMCVDLPLDKKLWKIRTGPKGRRAEAGRGPRAAGPSGRRAAGPLGRGGPWAAGRWAAGLLLAKPIA